MPLTAQQPLQPETFLLIMCKMFLPGNFARDLGIAERELMVLLTNGHAEMSQSYLCVPGCGVPPALRDAEQKNYELFVEEKITVHRKIKLIIIDRLEFSAYTDSSLSGENTQR